MLVAARTATRLVLTRLLRTTTATAQCSILDALTVSLLTIERLLMLRTTSASTQVAPTRLRKTSTPELRCQSLPLARLFCPVALIRGPPTTERSQIEMTVPVSTLGAPNLINSTTTLRRVSILGFANRLFTVALIDERSTMALHTTPCCLARATSLDASTQETFISAARRRSIWVAVVQAHATSPRKVMCASLPFEDRDPGFYRPEAAALATIH